MHRLLNFAVCLGMLAAAPLGAQNKPKRINRAIEMLEMGQPIYYQQVPAAGYDEGKRLAATQSDYILYEMEHGAFDFSELRAFMRGLVDGGPTKTGHRTPTVVVTLPVTGMDEATIHANAWVIQQTLAAGVHGILLCHARSPEAVRAFIEAARYPFAPKADGLSQGTRGAGSQSFASSIWGMPANEYLKKADVWPLNKEGEIMLGVKIEDSFALQNAEKTAKIPGLAFAEWGPTDMGFWLVGLPTGPNETNLPVMQAARSRVLAATKAAGISFLNVCNDNNVGEMLKEGVKICTGGYNAGRKITNNPWTY